MSERVYERFLLFMNAVDDDLLEEALTVPKRRRAVSWRSLAAAAACLCVVVSVLFWQSPSAPEAGVTAADLAGYGYELPLPADARNVRYDLLPSSSETPIAQAEFDRGGHAVTLRAWKTDEPQDIFYSETWTDQVDWTAGGAALALRSNDKTAQVSWYSDEIQWSVRSDMTPADLLDTVDSIFSTLGGQLNNAPEGAGDIHYNAFHLDGLAVGETTFTLDGVSCAYRIALTYDTSSDFADISGVAEEFDHRAEAEVGWCPARLAWNDGGAGKVVWFDVVPGQLYSLSVDAGAGRESLLDLASQLFLPAQDEL
jgi:hypothetical protein